MGKYLSKGSVFQSLIGLKINWNQQSSILTYGQKVFQSLIGLKINWNPTLKAIEGKISETFQSLIGLKINWNSA